MERHTHPHPPQDWPMFTALFRIRPWHRLLALAVLAAVFSAALAEDKPKPKTSAVSAGSTIPEGFAALFNGKDLSGWHGMPTFDPRKLAAMPEEERKAQIEKWNDDIKKHWKVEKGELVNDGQGVYLTTDKDRSEEHTSELQSHVK